MKLTLLKQFKLAVSLRSDPLPGHKWRKELTGSKQGPSLLALQGLGSSRLQGAPAPPLLMAALGREQALPGDIALEGENSSQMLVALIVRPKITAFRISAVH